MASRDTGPDKDPGADQYTDRYSAPDGPRPPQYRRAGTGGTDGATERFDPPDQQTRHFTPEAYGAGSYGDSPYGAGSYGDGRYGAVPPEGAGYGSPDYGRPPYTPVEADTPPTRRSSTGKVWTSVILLLAAGVALLFFVLWISDRGSGPTVETTVTRTVSPEATPGPAPSDSSDEPSLQLPTEFPTELPDLSELPTNLPSPEELDRLRSEFDDRVDGLLNELNGLTAN
ncbi:hypothetical protein [Corynebacterium provencense]|uniref:hypothetical protein n=1 Tax=Corynebacterium provencense TaxID=1737425 RepID=UPI00082D5383|nr:hypothetical protein [Corynebacterium provencense]